MKNYLDLNTSDPDITPEKLWYATITDIFGIVLNTHYTPYRHETRQIARYSGVGLMRTHPSEGQGKNIMQTSYHSVRWITIARHRKSQSGLTYNFTWVVIGSTSPRDLEEQAEYRPSEGQFKLLVKEFEQLHGLREND